MDWSVSQQVASSGSGSGMAPLLSDLVIMGCSAGAMGGQLWTDTLLAEFSYERAGVVPDSYLGDDC